MLIGPTAIAYSTSDVVAPAKLAKEYATKFAAFEIKGGSMTGQVLDLDGVQRLAAVPPKKVLYGQVVSGLITPIASLVMILGAICKKAEGTDISGVGALANVSAG
jgi:large subunit ribosomal protein L10